MRDDGNAGRGGPRRFLRQKEIAEELGINRCTIGKWMDKGIFPYILIAGRRRVTRELYEAWLLEHTEPGIGPEG